MTSKILSIADWEGFDYYEKSQIDSDAYAHILEFLLNEGFDISHPHCQYYEKKYIEAYTNLFFATNDLVTYLREQEPNMTCWFADFGTKTAEVRYGTNLCN